MCRTKKNAVLPPTPRRKPPRRKPPPLSRTSTVTSDSSNRDSKTSTSSHSSSLASIREALPESHQIYSYAAVAKATNNFLAKKIGRSAAWHCTVNRRDAVVIQRNYHGVGEFRTRLRSICSAHHANIAKLLGACVSGSHVYLVYEFVPGITLSDCLRNSINPSFTPLSTWIHRLQVASEVAHAIEYIHHYTGEPRIHSRIKSSGIIVSDSSLAAKVTHFGTAELSSEIEAESRSPGKISGTKGYMSPEYIESGAMSQKSDVYAFGIVLLELLSGDEPVKYVLDKKRGDYVRVSVVDSAKVAMERSEIRRWVDRRLNDSFPVDVVEKVILLALDCVGVVPERRPDMRQVAARLSEWLVWSEKWSEKIKIPTDFSVTVGPR